MKIRNQSNVESSEVSFIEQKLANIETELLLNKAVL